MKAKLLSLALIAIMILPAVAIFNPIQNAMAQNSVGKYNADSMWLTIGPGVGANSTLPTPTANGASVGYHHLFNVTEWMNVT
jgi:hypothetical protein